MVCPSLITPSSMRRVLRWRLGTDFSCASKPQTPNSIAREQSGSWKAWNLGRYLKLNREKDRTPEIRKIVQGDKVTRRRKAWKKGRMEGWKEAIFQSSILPFLPSFLSFFSRFTFHVSRFTFHVSRFTFHVSRFTLHVSRFASSGKPPQQSGQSV